MTSSPPLRPAARLAGVAPYQPPASRFDIDLRLDANEGPRAAERSLSALRSIDAETLRRYPSAAELEAELAARWGIDPARVIVTAGADDAIDRVCRAACEPGRDLLVHAPSFEMIPRGARLAGAEIRTIPWLDGAFPLEPFLERIDSAIGLVALVTPNNPTGGAIELADIQAVADAAEAVGALVLLDLAYAEFADAEPTGALLDRPNVVITRTFSKAKGLAGLRVGCAFAPETVAVWLRAAGGPYPVSTVSLAAASARLRETDAERRFVERISVERKELTRLLDALAARPLPTQANFVAARPADPAFAKDALASLGVAVRGYGPGSDAAGLLRITLPGDEDDFDRLTRSLRAALAPEALLFDLDGVLADVSRSYRAAIIETARAFSANVTTADIEAAKAAGGANNDWALARRLIAERAPDPGLDAVVERFQMIYLGDDSAPGLRETETLIPTRELLAALGGRLPLAIVTGRPRAETDWFLDRFGLADLFPLRVCMEDAPAKPDPAPVRLALERLGVRSAWMIGDTPDDLRAARAAGVVPLGVAPPGPDPAAVRDTLLGAGAARVIDSLADLTEILP